MRMHTSAASMAQSIAKPICIGLLLRFLQQPMMLLLLLLLLLLCICFRMGGGSMKVYNFLVAKKMSRVL